jgi:hypothetical protein
MLEQAGEKLRRLEGVFPWPEAGRCLGVVVNLPGRCVAPHALEGDGGAQKVPGEPFDGSRVSGRDPYGIVGGESRMPPGQQELDPRLGQEPLVAQKGEYLVAEQLLCGLGIDEGNGREGAVGSPPGKRHPPAR